MTWSTSLVDQWYGDVPGQGWFAPGSGDALPEAVRDDPTLAGTTVWFFYDHGGGPLWDEDGEITNDPEWLRRELGLSESLVGDLLAWVDAQDRREPGPPSAWEGHMEEALFERLRKELKAGLRVVRPG